MFRVYQLGLLNRGLLTFFACVCLPFTVDLELVDLESGYLFRPLQSDL
jgi:hypothetical protein